MRENIETAFLYADAAVLAHFAGILGKRAEQAELERYAGEVQRNYNEKLLVRHPEKGFWCYKAWDHPDGVFLTQAAQALPLYWGLAPEGKRDDIVKAFRRTLERDGAFVCGEVGPPYVIQTAREHGTAAVSCAGRETGRFRQMNAGPGGALPPSGPAFIIFKSLSPNLIDPGYYNNRGFWGVPPV